MTRLLLFVLLMAVAGFVAVYFFIASLFVLAPLPHGQHISLWFSLVGFCGPLILVCIHFATTHPDWSLRARRIMLRVYVGTVVVALLGMAPQLFFPDTRLDMAATMVQTVLWCLFCGAPIIAAWLNAVGDQRPK
jgi:hypothetical protein